MSEFVVILGLQACGKSTIVREFTERGYHRINRDTTGGRLEAQADLALRAFNDGRHNLVLDNTYLTTASRKGIIAAARKLGVPIRCVWQNTQFEDCLLNACLRMCQTHGRVLSPEECKKSKDQNTFPVAVLFKARKEFEPPTEAEGFCAVQQRDFTRIWPTTHVNKAVILDFDDTLRKSTGPNRWPEDPSHVEILPGRTEVLKQWREKGYLLLGASNQSAVAKGLPEDKCRDCFEKTLELLGVPIEYKFCPHKVPPVSCYCRKPGVGMAAEFIFRHKLRPSDCIMVGDATSDRTFAQRSGFQFQTPAEFFHDQTR